MDPAKLKVVELKAELSALGLDTKGVKAVLVDRLKKALSDGGQVVGDTTIADTSTEEIDDQGGESPPRSSRRPGPASRTRRRLSSAEPPSTPTRSSRRVERDEPKPVPPIEEEKVDQVLEVESDSSEADQECILSDDIPKLPTIIEQSPPKPTPAVTVVSPTKQELQPTTPVKKPTPIQQEAAKDTSPIKQTTVPAQSSPVKLVPAPSIQNQRTTEVTALSPSSTATTQPPVKNLIPASPITPSAPQSPVKVVLAQTTPTVKVLPTLPASAVHKTSPVPVTASKDTAPPAVESSTAKLSTQSSVTPEIQESPVKPLQQSPIKPAVEQSPIKPAVQQSPVKAPVQQSPVKSPVQQSPFKPVQPFQQSPVKPQPQQSPEKPMKVDMPKDEDFCAKEATPEKKQISKEEPMEITDEKIAVDGEPQAKKPKIDGLDTDKDEDKTFKQDEKGSPEKKEEDKSEVDKHKQGDETVEKKDLDTSVRDRDRRRRDKQSRWGSQNAESNQNDHDAQGGEYTSGRDEEDDRNRSRGRSSSANKRPREMSPRRKSPVKIPEPESPVDKITLSWYDSDLNLHIDPSDLTVAVPLTEDGFGLCWAGARASHGVDAGKVCYEVKVESMQTPSEGSPPAIRFGWSTLESSLHLGDGPHSWAYENSGRKVNNSEFHDYAVKFVEKDVIGVYLDLESSPCTIMFTVNGAAQETAFEFEKSILEGAALFPHVLSRNCTFKVNFGHDKFNLLTKTKVTRRQVEVPLEVLLEEKRVKDLQIQKEKEEKLQKEKEEQELRKEQQREREERDRIRKEAREKRRKDKPEDKDKMDKESKENGEKEKGKDNDSDCKEKTDKGGEKYDPMDNSDEDDDAKKEVDKDKIEKKEEIEEKTAEETVLVDGDMKKTEEKMEAEEIKPEESKPEESQILQPVFRMEIDIEVDGEEAKMLEGYVFIGLVLLEKWIKGPLRPSCDEQCEVIMMCGLPGSGKTYWALKHASEYPAKRFNILGTSSLIDRMKVDCKSFRAQHEGRWESIISKVTKCVVKLIEVAQTRRRNYILDQTNVYPSAQRRKMRQFTGCKRSAIVIVPDEETYTERQRLREEKDGKDVPDGAVLEMKANFVLPEKCMWLEEVTFSEQNEEEAKKTLEKYNREGKAAGCGRGAGGRGSQGPGQGSKRPRFDSERGRNFGPDRGGRHGGGGGGGPLRHRNDSRRDDRRGGGGGGWGDRNWGRGGGGGGGGWGGRDPPYMRDRNRDGGPAPYRGNSDRWAGGGGGGSRGGGGGGHQGHQGRDRGDSHPRGRPPMMSHRSNSGSDDSRGPPPPHMNKGWNAPRGGGSGGGGGAGDRGGNRPQHHQRPQQHQGGGGGNQSGGAVTGNGSGWAGQQTNSGWGQGQGLGQGPAWGQHQWNQQGWTNWGQQGWGAQTGGGWNASGAAAGGWKYQGQGQGQGQQGTAAQQQQWGQWPQQQGYWGTQWPVQNQGQAQSQTGANANTVTSSDSSLTGQQTTNQSQTSQQAVSAQHQQQQMWAHYAQAYAQQSYGTGAMGNTNVSSTVADKK